MMKEEFLEIAGIKKISEEEYSLIEFVYTFHPLISETQGKEQVAFLYKNFGSGIFKEMEAKAVAAQKVESKIFELERSLENERLKLTEMKKK